MSNLLCAQKAKASTIFYLYKLLQCQGGYRHRQQLPEVVSTKCETGTSLTSRLKFQKIQHTFITAELKEDTQSQNSETMKVKKVQESVHVSKNLRNHCKNIL